jgi:tRNA threonylcarbamoyladenosine biosynthesis protein TsaB
VAVLRGGALLLERAGDPSRTHGQRLPNELWYALAACGAAIDDVGLLAVVVGPGSFTGLRIGIATVQGLAMARGLRVVPVSAFEALAAHAAAWRPGEGDRSTGTTPPLIAPWIDAQRGEVFATLMTPAFETAAPPSAGTPEATLERWAPLTRDRAVVFAGDAAARHAEAIRTALGERAAILPSVPPLASAAARIAARDPARAVAPHALVPLYVRRPDAEIARDRRASGTPA